MNMWWRFVDKISTAWESATSCIWYWSRRRTKMVNVATIHGRMRVREYYDNDDIEMDLGTKLKVGDAYKYDGDVWEITEIPEYTLDDIETPVLCYLKPLSPHLIDKYYDEEFASENSCEISSEDNLSFADE